MDAVAHMQLRFKKVNFANKIFYIDNIMATDDLGMQVS